jgi:hypothetical protein
MSAEINFGTASIVAVATEASHSARAGVGKPRRRTMASAERLSAGEADRLPRPGRGETSGQKIAAAARRKGIANPGETK